MKGDIMTSHNSTARLFLKALFLSVACCTFFVYVSMQYTRQIAYSQTERQPFKLTADIKKQLDCLSRNIYWEAGSETFEGKVAVAQVTLNRVKHDNFPHDVCKVVYQKNIRYNKTVCQFSWSCDKSIKNKFMHPAIFRESEAVARKVFLEGYKIERLNDALYYHADYVRPGWKKQKITKIGHHIFYK